jgi:UDP-arabinose 4-epimerase
MTRRHRVLVTGGAGYVGSHACKQLSQAGFEPVAYDDLSRGHAALVRYGPLIQGRIHDRVALRAALDEVRPVACLHFAAFAYVGESIANPALYYDNNVAGSLALLQELVAADVTRLVFSSSCAVYGQPDKVPIVEAAPKHPMSPYGRSKLITEEMLADFDRAYGLRSVSLRYFNACGADPDGEVGELHDPEPHVIPRAMMAATGLIPRFEVLGADYPTPDGTAIRDYTHVADLAEAHVAALDYLLAGGATDAMNVGTGQGVSVREILDAVERVSGRQIPIELSRRRTGDPAQVIADPNKARLILGFEPRRVALDEMIETAWRWFQSNNPRTDQTVQAAPMLLRSPPLLA